MLTKTPSLLIILVLGVIVLVQWGCAPSRLKKIETLYEQGIYQEIVKLDVDCSELTQECFHIKFIRADSYYRLEDLEEASRYSQEAIDRIPSKVKMEEVNKLYVLRSHILFDQITLKESIDSKSNMLDELESSLNIALETNAKLLPDSLYIQQEEELTLLLAETILQKMEDINLVNLRELHEKLIEVAGIFGKQMVDKGYRQYYMLQAEFRAILPEVKKWIFMGSVKGEREQYLESLKGLYKESLLLRNTIIYRQGYSEKIERFLGSIDLYMKQFVL
jgi:hypothetical protein